MKKTALIIGWGVSGKAAAALLDRQGFSLMIAERDRSRWQENDFLFTTDEASVSLDGISLCVFSPGIDPLHPLLQKIRERHIEIVSETALALRFLSGQTMIAVTGTNGKTTTVLLTQHILQSFGKKARALGNIGIPLSAYLLDADPEEILVVELSSFQLEALPLFPYFDAAAILNITPNHLNRHRSMEEYAAAKLRLHACVKKGGALFVSTDIQKRYLPCAQAFDSIAWRSMHPRFGQAEWENQAAASALCGALGFSEKACRLACSSFRKPPHRIEWVEEINAVAYYNDSKASSVEAVMHAVRLFEAPLLLIAGGVDKGASYKPWIQGFQGKVKKMAVYGEAAQKIASELQGHVPLTVWTTMREAVEDCVRGAEKGDAVLLSPGCSSYDQFANFEERGNAFKHIVRGIRDGSKKNCHCSRND